MKRFIRNTLVVSAIVLTSPLWLVARIARGLGASDDSFGACSEIVGAVPGLLGIFLRRGFYRMTLARCAMDCTIGSGTWFSHPGTTIGNNVYIGSRCTIGMCEIGDDVLMGCNIDLISGRHQHHGEEPDDPRRHQGGTYEKVRIGRNAWIGNSAVIMADIGENSIVGAGSVVVKPIPPDSVAAGNPATVKRTLGT